MVFLEEACHRRQALRVKDVCHPEFSLSLLPACRSRWEFSACVLANILLAAMPFCHKGLVPSGAISPNKSFCKFPWSQCFNISFA